MKWFEWIDFKGVCWVAYCIVALPTVLLFCFTDGKVVGFYF